MNIKEEGENRILLKDFLEDVIKEKVELKLKVELGQNNGEGVFNKEYLIQWIEYTFNSANEVSDDLIFEDFKEVFITDYLDENLDERYLLAYILDKQKFNNIIINEDQDGYDNNVDEGLDAFDDDYIFNSAHRDWSFEIVMK